MLDMWREAVVKNPAFYIGWIGLLIGIVFGFTIQRTNFCTMGSISDILSFGDYRRFRSWLMAAAVAILGVALIERAGILDTDYSIYVSTNFQWGGYIIGGPAFRHWHGVWRRLRVEEPGPGRRRRLALADRVGRDRHHRLHDHPRPVRPDAGSGNRALSSDLSVLGFESQRMDAMLSAVTGIGAGAAKIIALVVFAGGLLGYCFVNKAFRTSATHIVAGLVIGLCVVAGWILTGLAFDEFADNPAVESLSYVRPAGDTIDYLMNFTAYGGPGFTVVTLIGALAGAFLSAITNRSFAFATFTDSADTLRNMFGALLMGIGGVTALGCTIGQSVTGFSTLALGSLITFVFIVIGGMIGVKTMEALA